MSPDPVSPPCLARLSLLALVAGCATAPAPAPPSDCARALADLRVRHDRLERDSRRARANDDADEHVFPDGPRLPEPERAITAGLTARLPAAYRLEGPDPVLCRAWFCQVSISWLNDRHTRLPEPPRPETLLEDSELVDETPSWTWRDEVDPDGRIRQINTYVVQLRAADGSPRTRQQLRQQAIGAPPATEGECQAERTRLQQDLARRQPALDRRWAGTRGSFEREEPNPALTAEIAAMVRTSANLSPRPDDQIVECRGSSCKVLLSDDDQKKMRKVVDQNRDRLQLGVVVRGGHQTRYLTVFPPAQVHSRALFRAVETNVETSRQRCEKEAPGRGGLRLVLRIPEADRLTGKDLRVSYEGSLAGTPLGRCISQLVDRQLGALTAEGPFAHATFRRDFLFGVR